MRRETEQRKPPAAASGRNTRLNSAGCPCQVLCCATHHTHTQTTTASREGVDGAAATAPLLAARFDSVDGVSSLHSLHQRTPPPLRRRREPAVPRSVALRPPPLAPPHTGGKREGATAPPRSRGLCVSLGSTLPPLCSAPACSPSALPPARPYEILPSPHAPPTKTPPPLCKALFFVGVFAWFVF